MVFFFFGCRMPKSTCLWIHLVFNWRTNHLWAKIYLCISAIWDFGLLYTGCFYTACAGEERAKNTQQHTHSPPTIDVLVRKEWIPVSTGTECFDMCHLLYIAVKPACLNCGFPLHSKYWKHYKEGGSSLSENPTSAWRQKDLKGYGQATTAHQWNNTAHLLTNCQIIKNKVDNLQELLDLSCGVELWLQHLQDTKTKCKQCYCLQLNTLKHSFPHITQKLGWEGTKHWTGLLD